MNISILLSILAALGPKIVQYLPMLLAMLKDITDALPKDKFGAAPLSDEGQQLVAQCVAHGCNEDEAEELARLAQQAEQAK